MSAFLSPSYARLPGHVAGVHICPSQVQVAARPRRRARLQSNIAAPTPVQIGDIVAVERGPGLVDVARVTGVDASGSTVDIELLEPFVKELYVAGKHPETFESAANVRRVRSEYVPSQDGWIVLDTDLDHVRAEFQATRVSKASREKVQVLEAPKKELSPEALQKQLFPKPTRSQAILGAALSVPIAAITYAAYASASKAYEANPVGEDFATSATFRQLVLFLTGSARVMSLVDGCALPYYAFSGEATES